MPSLSWLPELQVWKHLCVIATSTFPEPQWLDQGLECPGGLSQGIAFCTPSPWPPPRSEATPFGWGMGRWDLLGYSDWSSSFCSMVVESDFLITTRANNTACILASSLQPSCVHGASWPSASTIENKTGTQKSIGYSGISLTHWVNSCLMCPCPRLFGYKNH